MNVYSIKGYIYYNDTRKISDQINKYTVLRKTVVMNGSKIEFETVLETKVNRDDLMLKINTIVDTYGGHVVISECSKNEDGSIGSCIMTSDYRK